MSSHPITSLLGLTMSQPIHQSTGLRYLSLCSGIEAASVAWHSMGWQPIAFSEIEPFPSAVLDHHWPHVPNLGDMTRWREWPEDLLAQVDVLVGGTPCQAFSVAGLRNSLSDERGNLTLIYAHLLDHIDTLRAARELPPVICLWENVPGVFSTKDNAFGCFLGALAGEESALEPSGAKWSNAGWVLGPQRAIAWRTLDAQYFGVAQRRRRVFLVASARNDFSPEAVLFESQGVRRDSPPSREARQGTPTVPTHGAGNSGIGTYRDGGQVSQTLDAVLAKGQTMPEKNRFPAVLVPDTAHTLRAEGFDASEDGTGRGTPLVPVTSPTAEVIGCLNSSGGHAVPGNTVQDAMAHQLIPVAFSCKDHGGDASEIAPTLRSMGHDGSHANGGGQVAVAFHESGQGWWNQGEVAGCLRAEGENRPSRPSNLAGSAMQVRRLTPTECERLQGFPDGHTLIPWKNKPADDCPDGPRYKALGNSMAVPCMAWIGRRIQNNLPTP